MVWAQCVAKNPGRGSILHTPLAGWLVLPVAPRRTFLQSLLKQRGGDPFSARPPGASQKAILKCFFGMGECSLRDHPGQVPHKRPRSAATQLRGRHLLTNVGKPSSGGRPITAFEHLCRDHPGMPVKKPSKYSKKAF